MATTVKQDRMVQLSGDAIIVPDITFLQWTNNWLTQLELIADKHDEDSLKNFFLKNGQKMAYLLFNDQPIHFLLSSVGVKAIYAHFALVDYFSTDGTLTFSIILHGVDSLGNRCTAYYLGTPIYNYDLNLAEKCIENVGDVISDSLAIRWIDNWKDTSLNLDLFKTTYGNLQGYSYSVQDFMHSLYPPDFTYESRDIMIFLAAHDHMSHLMNEKSDVVFTFGLVMAGLAGQPKSQNKLLAKYTSVKAEETDGDDDVNTYYDLSLPSPPNHDSAN